MTLPVRSKYGDMADKLRHEHSEEPAGTPPDLALRELSRVAINAKIFTTAGWACDQS